MKHGRELEAGEKIEIELVDDEEQGIQYLSKVEEIIDGKTFVISRPMVSRKFTDLQVGEIIKVAYFRQDALYYFEAEVLEKIRREEGVSARIAAVSDRYKLQRRNFYRLSAMVPVIMVIEEGEDRIIKKYDTIDISGGGLRINTAEKYEKGRDVWLFINIPELQRKAIKAAIIRSAPSLKYLDLYETALEFKDMEQSSRSAVIKYIFDRQREMIKKGVR